MPNQTNPKQAVFKKYFEANLLDGEKLRSDYMLSAGGVYEVMCGYLAKNTDDIFAGIEANVIGEHEEEELDALGGHSIHDERPARNKLRSEQRQALKLEKEKWL